MTAESATLEKPQDAGPPPEGLVRRWIMELALADKEEENWRKEAKRVVELYRNEVEEGPVSRQAKRNSFNILWANTEILAPALYNSVPKPDVRRRFRDSDPVGKYVADIVRRALDYEVDDCELNDEAELAVMDYLLTGRAVVRVRYEPKVYGDVIQSQKVYPELVHWDDFRRGPGRVWKEVPWIAFRHRLTREEGVQKLGEIWNDVPLEETEVDDKTAEELPPDSFKRGVVWEIWDKSKKQIIWIAPAYKSKPLKVSDDVLRLQGFFPIPRPLYSIETSGSLVPVPEYCLYEDQAKELERVTKRIQGLVNACRVRGVYNSVISELRRLLEMDSEDNELLPAENIAALMQSGGLEKHIWLLPIDAIARVLIQLYEQREQLKQTIYEITGIADIFRGASKASETARAQEIKSQFGTLRLKKRQGRVAKFMRDIIRLMGEVIAEKFEPAQLAEMTGIQLPTQEQKALAQAQAQAMSAQQQPVPLELQQQLMLPSWEEITDVLRSDAMRGYRIDIETDSTVQEQVIQEQKDITDLLNGVVTFLSGVAPAVQSGAMPVDTAKTLLLAAVRRFRLGNEVEDALNKLEAPKGPPEEVARMQQQMQQERDALEGEKQKLADTKRQLDEQVTQKSMQLMEREYRLQMDEMRQAHAKELLARDQRDFEATRSFEDRLAKLQQDSAQADMAATDASQKLASDAMDRLAKMIEGALTQMAENVAAVTETVARHAETMTAAAERIEQSVASIAQFQRSPKRVIRGSDGTVTVQEARTVQ